MNKFDLIDNKIKEITGWSSAEYDKLSFEEKIVKVEHYIQTIKNSAVIVPEFEEGKKYIWRLRSAYGQPWTKGICHRMYAQGKVVHLCHFDSEGNDSDIIYSISDIVYHEAP